MVKVRILFCFTLFWGFACGAAPSTASITPASTNLITHPTTSPLKADPQSFIADVARIYRASMAYIFNNQPLINQTGGNKSALFGHTFINNVKKSYHKQFNQPFPTKHRRLHTLLLRTMVEVMEANRTLIYDDNIGFKGLIPATFAAQLSESLSKKGLGVSVKFTNTYYAVRNQMNLPDYWEVVVMDKLQNAQRAAEFDDTSKVDGYPAYRYFVPVKMQRFCLNCHGRPDDNPLNVGKPLAQWTSVDITGFEMENWQLGDFAGGVSVSIYKKDFLLLKEPCAFDDLSNVACNFELPPQ